MGASSCTGATAILAVSALSPAVAMTGANPGKVVRTSPVLVTDANATLSLVHVTVAPAITLPAESRAVAVSWTLSPAVSVSTAGLTVRVAMGTGGGSTTSDSWHATTTTAASTSARVDRRMRVQYTSGLGRLRRHGVRYTARPRQALRFLPPSGAARLLPRSKGRGVPRA